LIDSGLNLEIRNDENAATGYATSGSHGLSWYMVPAMEIMKSALHVNITQQKVLMNKIERLAF